MGVLGPVYRAYQPDPGRLVAVKQFRLDLPPENAHRFVSALERLIAADLTHLGIAAPLAAGMTENSPFLALDFVAAESFDVVIRDYGPAPVAEALRIASQLGGALDFAAAVNVYHGALHPRDVLVSTDETRVTGLGIAQILDSLGVAPPVRRPYTAPERVAGAAWDRRADIFSLAALVFEMLFGRRVVGVGAFAADSVTPIDGADAAALRAIFTQALAEDPAERFATALEFAEALHVALQQSGTPAKPRGRRRRDAEPRQSRRDPSAEPDLPLMLAIDAEPDPQIVESDLPRAMDPDLDRIDAHLERALPVGTVAAPEPEVEAEVEPEVQPDERFAPEPIADDPPQDVVAPAEMHLADIGDIDLRTPGEEREEAAFEPDVPVVAAPERPQPSALGYATSLTETAIEESRSAVWPILLALTVGLLVGFAGGYGVANRDRTPTAADATPAAALPPVSSAAGSASTPGDRPLPPEASSAQASSAPAAPVATDPAAPAARVEPIPAPAPAPAAPAASAAPAAAPAARAPSAPRPAPARPAAARVTVRSTPSGARVSVDGRDAGTTPVTLEPLARGTHVVRIALQGYVTAQRRVRIGTPQTAQSIEVALEATRPARPAAAAPPAPERTSGSLMVDSRPAGARVFVDGKMVGTTPLLIDEVAAGDHTVRLELDGFSSWTAASRVTGGERTRVSGSLEQR